MKDVLSVCHLHTLDVSSSTFIYLSLPFSLSPPSPFLSPPYSHETLYNAHYGSTGFKYQATIAPNGISVDVAGPYPGRPHDSAIALDSMLEERLSAFATHPVLGNFLVYGDPAYRLSHFIHKPFDRIGATQQERMHNTVMSTGRVNVEIAIGGVTKIFPALDFIRCERPGDGLVCMKYLVAVIFRNMYTCVRGGNQVSVFFDCKPPTLHEFLAQRPRLPPRLVELGVYDDVAGFFDD